MGLARLREMFAKKLDFRLIDGLAERVIFREFYPRNFSGGKTPVSFIDDQNILAGIFRVQYNFYP